MSSCDASTPTSEDDAPRMACGRCGKLTEFEIPVFTDVPAGGIVMLTVFCTRCRTTMRSVPPLPSSEEGWPLPRSHPCAGKVTVAQVVKGDVRVFTYERPKDQLRLLEAFDALVDLKVTAGMIPTRDEWLAHCARFYDRMTSERG